MGSVGIVCDSTCDLGPGWLADHGVEMVPLRISIEGQTYRDWLDLGPAEFYEKLAAAPELPKTSQPSPAEFASVYERLAAGGCEGVVSLHLSAAISGTYESAVLAAGMVDVPVRVIDTLATNVGAALPIIAAIEERDAGGDLEQVESAARRVVDSVRTLFALDTLEYLVKGGRAGRAQGLAASLLSIKPVLTFDRDGVIAPYKNVKGAKKALQEIATSIARSAGEGGVRVGLLHGESPELAEDLAAAIDATGVRWEHVITTTVGAVIGTYAGPHAVGAAFYPVP